HRIDGEHPGAGRPRNKSWRSGMAAKVLGCWLLHLSSAPGLAVSVSAWPPGAPERPVRDVAAEVRAVVPDLGDRVICRRDGGGEVGAERGHPEDATPGGDEPPVDTRRPGVEDADAGSGFRRLDARDRVSGRVAPRVA